MSMKKIAMMLTIMLITILSASCFYIVTGETSTTKDVIVNSTVTEDGDYEKVYGEGPYTEKNGKKYYIRYTGKVSGRTTVDLEDTNVKRNDGKPNDGCGLTIGEDKYPYIFGQKIESTYKMFCNNKTLYRVFIPSSIAFAEDDTSLTSTKYKGIQPNTFDGTKQVIDCIYHTPELLNKNMQASNLTSKYDKTKIITQSNVQTYVYLGEENIDRTETPLGVSEACIGAYRGAIQNVFVSNDVVAPSELFYNHLYEDPDSKTYDNGALIKYVLFDTGETWYKNEKQFSYLFWGQTGFQFSEHFKMPEYAYLSLNGFFAYCTGITELPKNFKIPQGITRMDNFFCGCTNLSGIVEIPSVITTIENCFFDTGKNSQKKIGTTGKPIVARVITGSFVDTTLTSANYSTVYVERVASFASSDQSHPVVIDESANDKDTTINTDINQEASSNKVVIEDETEWVSVTVMKKSVDEVVTETQTNSQSVENVEENKNEGDEVEQ